MVSMSKAEKGGISLLIYNQHLLEKGNGRFGREKKENVFSLLQLFANSYSFLREAIP